MKQKSVIIKALTALSLALTISCDSSHQSLSPESPFLSPKEKKVQVNLDGEKVIILDPVNEKEWKDPDLQNLELKIREARRKRVSERLAALAEEKLEFKNPVLTLKEDGQDQIKLDVIFQGKTQEIVFKSPKDHGQDFYFDQVSGFEDRKVRLQGMCLDDAEKCNRLAIQVSYIYKKLRVTEQFIMNAKVEDDEVEEENVAEEVEEDDPILDSEEEETEQEDKAPVASDKDGETDLIPLEEDGGLTAAPGITLDEENKDTPKDETSIDLSPLDPNLNDTEGDKTDDVEIDLSAPKQDEVDLEAPKDETPIDLSAPVDKPEEDVEIDTPVVAEEDKTPVELSKPEDTLIEEEPTAKDPVVVEEPETKDPLAEDPGTENPLFEEEPTNVGETNVDLDHDDPDLVLGDGQIIFPDISKGEEDEEEDVDEEFNVNSAEATPVEKDEPEEDIEIQDTPATTPEDKSEGDSAPDISLRPKMRPDNLVTTSKNSILLSKIKDTVFKQSRGFYSAHTIKGRIKNASKLSTEMDGAIVNPTRRERHYSSGMLKSVLELAARKLGDKYPDSPLCINDLSAKNGGKLGGHGSHRNGLDADISLPSSSNKCRGSFFHSWSSSKDKDSKFMEKNWFLLNTLIETERVHVIFTSSRFVRSMCSYVKRNTRLSKSQRNKIFKKLHHADGHHRHFHVRLKCNKQNPGCVTQGVLTGSTCN